MRIVLILLTGQAPFHVSENYCYNQSIIPIQSLPFPRMFEYIHQSGTAEVSAWQKIAYWHHYEERHQMSIKKVETFRLNILWDLNLRQHEKLIQNLHMLVHKKHTSKKMKYHPILASKPF